MSHHEHPVCGRCGAYRHLHPTKWCASSRRSFWLDEHHLVMHITGWLWTKLSDKARWWVVTKMYDLQPGRYHWCDLVDAAIKAGPDWVGDYRDDWCDVPTPLFGVGRPPTKACYCNDLPFEPVKSQSSWGGAA